MKYSYTEIAEFLYPVLLLFREQYGLKKNIKFSTKVATDADIIKLATDIENYSQENLFKGQKDHIFLNDVRKILITEPSEEFKEFQNDACKIAYHIINTFLCL